MRARCAVRSIRRNCTAAGLTFGFHIGRPLPFVDLDVEPGDWSVPSRCSIASCSSGSRSRTTPWSRQYCLGSVPGLDSHSGSRRRPLYVGTVRLGLFVFSDVCVTDAAVGSSFAVDAASVRVGEDARSSTPRSPGTDAIPERISCADLPIPQPARPIPTQATSGGARRSHLDAFARRRCSSCSDSPSVNPARGASDARPRRTRGAIATT